MQRITALGGCDIRSTECGRAERSERCVWYEGDVPGHRPLFAGDRGGKNRLRKRVGRGARREPCGARPSAVVLRHVRARHDLRSAIAGVDQRARAQKPRAGVHARPELGNKQDGRQDRRRPGGVVRCGVLRLGVGWKG
jgi:hypothetical protein